MNSWILFISEFNISQVSCWPKIHTQHLLTSLRRIWEKCWEDGIQTWSIEPEMAYDPSKLNRITFDGKYHSLRLQTTIRGS